MIRVLHVLNSMGYGGIETFLMNVYRKIDKNEVQFDFLVNVKKECAYNEEIRKLGGNIYYLPKRGIHFLKYKHNWKKFLEKEGENFSAIHMHVSSLTDIQPLVEAKKAGIKNRFIHAHNTHQTGIIHNVLNKINQLRINQYATKMFACSSEAGNYCFKAKTFEIIKNGIDCSKYQYDIKKREEIRKKLNLEDNEIAVVHVGRFSKQKNHSFLIDFFHDAAIQKENLKLFLIGDGVLKKEIQEKVENLQLKDKVNFLGLRNDINEILQGMDLFVLPSLHEGLPVAGIEAQAAGLKCLFSDTISQEVAITDLVSFLSITNKECWSKEIMSFKNYPRKDTTRQITQAGYNIIDTTNKLQEIYLANS